MILLPSVHVGPIQATMLVSVLGDILDKVSLVIVPVSTKGASINDIATVIQIEKNATEIVWDLR